MPALTINRLAQIINELSTAYPEGTGCMYAAIDSLKAQLRSQLHPTVTGKFDPNTASLNSVIGWIMDRSQYYDITATESFQDLVLTGTLKKEYQS